MQVIDSHTEGEPTRVILNGGPDLGDGPLAARAARLESDHWPFCRALSAEPRGQVAMVCALLVPPSDPDCVTGVIYFDAGAVLGMCGHGTIGLTVTLARLGRIGPGRHRIETPAGIVTVELLDRNTVRLTNVESRRTRAGLEVDLPGGARLTGDVAYGGNWFYLVDPSPIPVNAGNIRALSDLAIAARGALAVHPDAEARRVDHVVFHGPSPTPGVHSRNFVLCPDDAYDRSPCGTGSSARLASLVAAGRLTAGEEIVQESVIGSRYLLSCRTGPTGGVIPVITGKAYVIAESTLIFDPADPFRDGIDL